MNPLTGKLALAATMTAGLALAGCATQPYGNNGYYQGQSRGYSNQPARCNTCGVVQEVQQVYVQGGSGNGGTWVRSSAQWRVASSAVPSARVMVARRLPWLARWAAASSATRLASATSGDTSAWRIVVRLDDGRYATVTQRDNPGLRRGDYVEVRGDQVYPR